MQDNELLDERDSEVQRKALKLKDELKQVQIPLIEVPIEFTHNVS